MSAFEFGSTGSRETSRFQGLSAGKTVRSGSGGGSVPPPDPSVVTVIEAAGDQADARLSATRLRRERKEYVPAPASGTKGRLAAVWAVLQFTKPVVPGRRTWTSNAKPEGAPVAAHRTVKDVAVLPAAGVATTGTWI